MRCDPEGKGLAASFQCNGTWKVETAMVGECVNCVESFPGRRDALKRFLVQRKIYIGLF
jgi:hypothetical protein